MSARIAVVTGASVGIGRDLSVELARTGFEPLLLARRTDKLEETASAVRQAGGTAHVLGLDVTGAGAARKALEAAERLGIPEALVNNAGKGFYGDFDDVPLPQALEMIDLNVRSLVEFTGVFLPGFLSRRKGYVLNVASTAAFQPTPHQAVYSATKSFVLSFSEALSVETATKGVKVCALCPGPTTTEFFEVGGYATRGLKPPKMVFMSSRPVAKLGVRAMLAGTPIAIPGVANKVGALAAKFTPRPVVRAVAERLFRASK